MTEENLNIELPLMAARDGQIVASNQIPERRVLGPLSSVICFLCSVLCILLTPEPLNPEPLNLETTEF